MKLCSLQPFDLTTFYYFKKGLLLLLQRHYAGGWHKRPPPASTVFATASIAYTTVLTGVNCYVPAIYFPCVTQIYYDLVSDKNCYGRQRHTYTAYFIQIRPCMYSCNFILWMHTDQEYVRRDTYLHLQIIRRKKFEKKNVDDKRWCASRIENASRKSEFDIWFQDPGEWIWYTSFSSSFTVLSSS
jgi:hypothetical protein